MGDCASAAFDRFTPFTPRPPTGANSREKRNEPEVCDSRRWEQVGPKGASHCHTEDPSEAEVLADHDPPVAAHDTGGTSQQERDDHDVIDVGHGEHRDRLTNDPRRHPGSTGLPSWLAAGRTEVAPLPDLSSVTGMTTSSRRNLRSGIGVSLLLLTPLGAVSACSNSKMPMSSSGETSSRPSITLYRQVGCSCCATYADYLRKHGFQVTSNTMDDLTPIRAEQRVPEAGVGCHTSVVDGYVVEGHVPVEAIERLLNERPNIDGISVVGMPVNSPGMGEPNGRPLDVLTIDDGEVAPYMSITTF